MRDDITMTSPDDILVMLASSKSWKRELSFTRKPLKRMCVNTLSLMPTYNTAVYRLILLMIKLGDASGVERHFPLKYLPNLHITHNIYRILRVTNLRIRKSLAKCLRDWSERPLHLIMTRNQTNSQNKAMPSTKQQIRLCHLNLN